jgi:isoquinoline 1-oxidoreductase subunit beta
VKASNHEVLHQISGRKLGYGALAEAASSLTIPVDIKLKDPSDFRYVGKGKTDIVDGFDITTGRAQYGIDIRVDGMLYGVVARPAVYAGKVKPYDASETMKVPGVVTVVLIEGTPPHRNSSGRRHRANFQSRGRILPVDCGPRVNPERIRA